MASSLEHSTANNDKQPIEDSRLTKADGLLHHLHYGQDKISYEVIRKDKARKLRIKVHPDQRVVVTVPMQVTDEFIHNSVKKRARWIWQSLQEFAKQKDHVLPKRYVSGETQFYLGRRYVLKVITDAEANDVINSTVKLSRGKLNVELSQIDSELDSEKQAVLVKSLIDKWYKEIGRAHV